MAKPEHPGTASDATLANVRRIVDSAVYKEWKASSKGAALDAAKIEKRLLGIATPGFSSKFAQGLGGIIGNPVAPPPPPPKPPPDPPPPPPPLSQLDPLWRRDGVFVRRLSSFSGVQRDAAMAKGFTRIDVQLDNSDDVAANEAELEQHGALLRSQGWVIAGWATFGQGTDAHADGARAADIVERLKLAGWKANGEAWAEHENIGKSREWLDGWAASGGRGPIGVSCLSSTTPNYAREFDYAAWLGVPGCVIEPQVYGASDPAYTVANALATLAHAGVPKARTALAFNVIAGEGPWDEYRKWPGPRTLWTGDDSTAATFVALAR